MAPELLDFLLYAGAVVGTVALLLVAAHLIGERSAAGGIGSEPFESGIRPWGDARVRISPHFYLVAMLFVIFDLETVFIITWAAAFDTVGWVGFGEITLFVTLLLAALVYVWRRGALAPDGARQMREEGPWSGR